MNIVKRLENFVTKVFKTILDVFLDALKLSTNAQGYVSGSISELLLKRYKRDGKASIVRIISKNAKTSSSNRRSNRNT